MIVNYKMIFLRGGGVSLITGASDIYIPFKLSTSFKCIKKDTYRPRIGDNYPCDEA